MRTHDQIITDAGGYQKLAATLGLPAGRVRFWQRRESIPAEFWKQVADNGVTTLDELADAAAQRRPPEPEEAAA